MAAKIKKGDKVVVLTGRDKGRSGEVASVDPRARRAIVKEASIDLSNLAIADPKTGKPTRVGFKILDDGRKVRFAKLSGDLIDG